MFAQHPTEIEHIGSTSVPGLCAKPIIDVLVGTDSLAVIEAETPSLSAAGYEYVSKYESDLPMRRYFVRFESEGPRVNVHAVCKGSKFWTEHLAFRDALRASVRVRDAYANLKLELARTHKNDRPAYTAAKAPFIVQVLSSVRASAQWGLAPRIDSDPQLRKGDFAASVVVRSSLR